MVSLSMACRQASRPFRILALPLSKPRTLTPSSAPSPTTNNNTTTTATPATSQDAPKKTPLMLFQVIQPDPPTDAPPNLTKKVLDKASDFWLALGKKDPNTILYKCYKQGEKLMDRIEYEEWSLKSISEGQDVKIVEKGKESEQKHIEIPLLRPTLQDQPLPPLVPKLHRFLLHRIPFHRKMMWRSILVSPVTWPLAIIPVIPNFALFYVLWRAWSHYKAWRGALYLEELLKRGMIVERPSKELDQVYASKAPASITGSENSAPDETSSTDTSNKASPGAYEVDEKVVRDGEKLVPQAKGEEGAVDGTATPKSMVYHGESSASSTSSSSIKSGSGERTSEKIEKETLEVKNGAKEEEQIKPAASHPSLLLRPYHVPMLSKLFDLRPLEIIDVERAVEQAGLRAQKADEGKK